MRMENAFCGGLMHRFFLRGKLRTATLFLVSFAFLVAFAPSVSAAANILEVQSVELTELSATAEGSVLIGEDGIKSNIRFGKLNDTAKYVITLKNIDNKERVIKGISDNNESPYITYEYESHTNEQINAGANFVFIVTAKYANYIPNADARAQANNVIFRIQFADHAEEIAITPDTSDSIKSAVAILAVSIIGCAVCVICLIKKRKKVSKIIAICIVSIVAIASVNTARAVTMESSNFTLAADYALEPGRLVHYDGNYPDGGSMTDDYWTADGALKPNAFTAIGYHFAGWSLEPDEEKVYDDKEPMRNIPDGDEPLTLYVIWEPNTYSIVFHANSEQATGNMNSVVIEYGARRYRLPYNEFDLDGYRFMGWKKDNEGDLIGDHADSSQFDVEDGGTVNLYAQWELVPVGIDYYKNSVEAAGITLRQENFGRTTILRTPNYYRDGYGFAGWNTEPDGTGTMYGPNERVTMPADGLRLYATWAKAEENVTMQTFDDTAEPYASYSKGKVIALKDNRDNQVYTVAKLPDGKWWMTENLRLVPAGIQLTAENTNNPTQAVQNITGSASLCTESTAACINRFVYNNSNLRTSGSGLFAYGNGVYYNTYAATAGHAAVDENNLVSGQVAGDICPKGWHLPISGEDSDFKNLDISLGGTGRDTVGDYEHVQKYFKAPINLVAAGWGEGVFATYMNISGDAVYLESGTNGLTHSVSTFVDSSFSINGGTTEKYYTHTVRCLAN